ncbi:hypothetical protein LINPERHAP1_LOCUS1919 [Linum perenne]
MFCSLEDFRCLTGARYVQNMKNRLVIYFYIAPLCTRFGAKSVRDFPFVDRFR